MRPPPPIRPPRPEPHVERLFHTTAGPFALRGPARYMEQVRVIPFTRPGVDRPYDWQRDDVRVLPLLLVPGELLP